MQQDKNTMLPIQETKTASRTMASCAMNKKCTQLRTKLKLEIKKPKLLWVPVQNELSRILVIIALLLVMLAGLTTAKGASNSYNIHKKSTMTSSVKEQYSQPLYSTASSEKNDEDVFRPMIPKDITTDFISRNMFTSTGHYRVFQPVESDLRRTTAIFNSNQRQRLLQHQRMRDAEGMPLNSIHYGTDKKIAQFTERNKHEIFDDSNSKILEASNFLQLTPTTERTTTTIKTTTTTTTAAPTTAAPITAAPTRNAAAATHDPLREVLKTELKSLEVLLNEYVQNFFNKAEFEPLPELIIELQNKHANKTTTTLASGIDRESNIVRRIRGISRDEVTSSTSSLLNKAATEDKIYINLPRALETGRLLFFTGLKKILWPIFVGLQILKSLLLAMFLPSLIGSFGKLVGKGIAQASIRPMEAPQELDFRDNSFNFDEENNKFNINDDGGGKDGAAYAYNHPEASQTHYTYDAANINNQALSRYGINEKQLNKMPDTYLSVLQSLGAASFKNSGSFSSGSSQPGGGTAGLATPTMRPKPMAAANLNNFQTFQKVPASSLLLSNYDPFYSPLLSRLDSVFAQLKLNSENEMCREKLICLMYANPAKYAPYSNLVSAQLSRELNELRKPTSDNPDILRFFKYMRAAKDGQDGVDCEDSFDGCKEFKDFENPAMVSTYHDINKLVQARKIS